MSFVRVRFRGRVWPVILVLAAGVSVGVVRLLARRPGLVPARLHQDDRRADVWEPDERVQRRDAPDAEGARGVHRPRQIPVLPQDTGVDALLAGEVTASASRLRASLRTSWRRDTSITMTARIELRDLRQNTVLWENPSLLFRQDYDATAREEQPRSAGVLRPGSERARPAQQRIRARDRQRDSRGVLTPSRCRLLPSRAATERIDVRRAAPGVPPPGRRRRREIGARGPDRGDSRRGAARVQYRARPCGRHDERRPHCRGIAAVSTPRGRCR